MKQSYIIKYCHCEWCITECAYPVAKRIMGNLHASLILYTFLFTGFLSSTISAQDSLHQTITTQYQVEVSDSTSHPKPNVKVSAISAFHLWNNDPIKSMAIRASGHWDELSILVEPVIVNDPYGPDILGVDYTRSGISGRITNAFIRYENDLLTFQLGRAPVLWGSIVSSGDVPDVGYSPIHPFNHSIYFSSISHLPSSIYPPSYDHLDIRFKLGQFRLEILSGQLGSEELNGDRIKRNIAGHRLTWLSQDKKIFASFGEQIIYTGINRGFEWHYLNPFVPYFFTALEGDEESSDTGDNDNSIIFATFRYMLKPNLSFFGELLIDDFQVDDNNYQDGLGFQLGADGFIKISEKTIIWSLDWTRINSWTYIHHGQFTSWQNRGHSLGYPYGPDLNAFHIQADIEISKSLSFNIEADWLEKGSNTLSTPWGNSDNKDDLFPNLPVTQHRLFSTGVSWFWKYGIIEAGWSNYDFPNKIAFSDPQTVKEGSLFLTAQFFYTLDFNL